MATALIGTRLREKRQELGLRQAEVAQRAAISPAYLNLIEHHRRNVSQAVLGRLAAALGAAPEHFSDAVPNALGEDLRAAAAAVPGARAETHQLEAFSARFAGWAALVAALHGRNLSLEASVHALSHRFSHDPHLSDALHELLSALAGVRASAAILAQTEDLGADWERKFQGNLFEDSERLARGAGALVDYLDRAAAGAAGRAQDFYASPQEEVEAWLSAGHWQAGVSEACAPEAWDQEIAALSTGAAQAMARAHIAQARADAAAMPLTAFRRAAEELGYDPGLLALRFSTSPLAAMRRIAMTSEEEIGLVICDAAGALRLRKPLTNFPMPRTGAACALWPLFTALGRSGTAQFARLREARGAEIEFGTLSYCQSFLPQGFGGPELRSAAMLIWPMTPPAPAAQGPRARAVRSGAGAHFRAAQMGDSARPALEVGSSCSVCPRPDCPARRTPPLLATLDL